MCIPAVAGWICSLVIIVIVIEAMLNTVVFNMALNCLIQFYFSLFEGFVLCCK